MEKLGASEFLASCDDRVIDDLPLRERRFALGALAGIQAVALLAGANVATAHQDIFESQAEYSCPLDCEAIPNPAALPLPKPTDIPRVAKPATKPTVQKPAPKLKHEASKHERIRREPLREFLEGKIDVAPTLEDLARLAPEQYADWRQQLAYIEVLDKAVNVTPADYRAFHFNDTYIGAFDGLGDYNTIITPQLIVPHWSVDRYPAGLAGGKRFADSLVKKRLSSNYMVSHTSENVFRFYKSDTHMTAGGRGLNDMAIHIEIEAGLPTPDAPDPTVLFDITPSEVERTIITIVKLARRYKLAISKYTVIEHLRADLLFANKSYNPWRGTFDKLRKYDTAPDFTNMVVRKAAVLDEQVG